MPVRIHLRDETQERRIEYFMTWMGSPVLPHSERISFIPSTAQDDSEILYIVDDGLQCIAPAIHAVLPEYGPTVDYDIKPGQWRRIIRIWRALLSDLGSRLKSSDPFDYKPYSFGRNVMLHLESTDLDHAAGVEQYRSFLNEIIAYLEHHLDDRGCQYITLTGL